MASGKVAMMELSASGPASVGINEKTSLLNATHAQSNLYHSEISLAPSNSDGYNDITETDNFLLSENTELASNSEQSTETCLCIQDPEGPEAWVIAFAGMCVTFCVSSELYVFGIYYVDYVELFGVSEAAVGWIRGVKSISSAICSVLAGTLIEVFGCQIMTCVGGICLFVGMFLASFSPNIYVTYLTHGLIFGAGTSILKISVAVCVQQHFIRNKVLGAGIWNFGFPLAGFLFPILTSLFINTYGFRGALLLHAAVMANVIPLGMLMKSPKSDRTEQHLKTAISRRIKQDLLDISLLKDPAIVWFLAAGLLTYYNVSTYVSHVVGRAMFYGVSADNAAYLLSSISVSGCCAWILATVFGNMKWVNAVLVYGIGLIVASVASIMFGLIKPHEFYIIPALLFGFGMDTYTTISTVAYVSLIGVDRLPKFMGFFNVVLYGGVALGPLISGIIIDATWDYDLPFYLAGFLSMLSAIIVLGIAVVNHRTSTRQKDDTKS